MHIALMVYVYSAGEAQRNVAQPHEQNVTGKTEKGIYPIRPTK